MNRAALTERCFDFSARAVQVQGQEAPELWAEGYAVRFNSPTVLFEVDGVEYREQIASSAFQNCRMEDVIFNYDHQGKVLARTRNHTLQLRVDAQGLFIRARLDGTEEGRKLYDEIAGGYVDRMSFRFTIREEKYNKDERMWTVEQIKRLYDVSAVSIPAYDDTSIAARKAALLEADAQEQRRAELLEADAQEQATAAEAALASQRLALEIKLKL